MRPVPRPVPPLAIALLALALAACHGPAMYHPLGRPLPEPNGRWRYDQEVEISCHNCYEKRKETDSLTFRSTLARTRNLEVDIHSRPSKRAAGGVAGRSWFVRHDDGPANNANNCPGADRKENDLVGCLRAVRDWTKSGAGPRPVVTLFLDLKFSEWEPRRAQADLDTLLVGVFGRRKLFTPADLRGARPTVRAAARDGAWPTVDSLRGHVVVVLTGGEKGIPLWPRNRVLREYARGRGDSAAAFVAPSVRSTRQVRRPNSFTPADAERLAFYNFWGEFHGLARVGRAIREHGGVGRLWLNNETLRTGGRYSRVQTFCNAAHAGFQRLASKRYAEDRLCPGDPGPEVARQAGAAPPKP